MENDNHCTYLCGWWWKLLLTAIINNHGDDISQAFIHLIREIGQIAYALETKNKPVLDAKVTEALALLKFLAFKHDINTESLMETMYSKKLANINSKNTEKPLM